MRLTNTEHAAIANPESNGDTGGRDTGGRERRKKARHRDVIFGALDERLAMLDAEARRFLTPSENLADPQNGMTGTHAVRIRELLDELRRSLGKAESE